MARLRHIKSGAVISVADEKVARMGAEWEPADKATPKKTAPRKAAAKKSETD